MNKPLAVGDRVRVYGHLGPFEAMVIGVDETVNSRYGAVTGMVRVQNEDGQIWFQHPKQCRRLKAKPKDPERVERREWWVNIQDGLAGKAEVFYRHKNKADAMKAQFYPKCIPQYRLVEIHSGEMIINPNEVANKIIKELNYQDGSLGSDIIRKLLKEHS